MKDNQKQMHLEKKNANSLGIIIALMLGYSMVYMDKSLIALAVIPIQSNFNLSNAQIGSLMSFFFLGYSLMQIPAGWLSDKFGSKKVLLVSLTIIIICSLGFAASSLSSVAVVLSLMIAIRFVQGLGHAGYPSSCSKSVAENFPKERRPFVQALMLCTSGIGAILAYTLGAYFVSKNWPTAYIILAIGFALSLVLICVFLPKAEAKPKEKSGNSFVSLLKNRNVIILFIAMLLINFQLYGNMSWLPKYLSQKFSLSANQTALLLIPNAIAQTVATLFAGKLISKLFLGKEAKVIIVSAILSAVFITAFIFSSNMVMAVIFMVLSTCCAITIFTTVFTWPHKILPSEQIGSSIGIINTGGTLGGFLAPLILGFIIKSEDILEQQGVAPTEALMQSQKSYEMAFLLLAAATIVSGLIMLLIRDKSKTQDTK